MEPLRHDISIAASPQQVWRVLMDFPAYPAWNPFIRGIDGKVILGKAITVHSAPPGNRPTTYRAIVRAAETAYEFRWSALLLMPGLFDREHAFRLDPQRDGGCRFVQEETFGGILLPMFERRMRAGTLRGFAAMNEALKARVEKLARDEVAR